MASTSTAWVATHCAALTCHGAEMCRSSNPDMTIQAKHNQVGIGKKKSKSRNVNSIDIFSMSAGPLWISFKTNAPQAFNFIIPIFLLVYMYPLR